MFFYFLGIKKREVRFYSKGIGLSVCPSKHLGFDLRVRLETLDYKVVRVSHKLLCNINLVIKIVGN